MCSSDLRYSSDFHISEKGGVIGIVIPEVCKYDPAWTLGKMKLVSLLREHVDFKSVHLIEEWTKAPPVEKKEEKAEEHKHEEHKHEHKHEEPKEEKRPEEKKEG